MPRVTLTSARWLRHAAQRPVWCCAACAVLFALAAPPVGWWPLALVCLAPMAVAFRNRKAAERAGWGALTGALAALLTVVLPLGSALNGFFGLSPWLGMSCALGIGGFFGAAGFALCGWLAGPLRSAGPASVARFAAAWVAGDLLRSHLLTGLPWLLLGHLLAPAPALCQMAAWGGTALVSFWLAATGAWLAIACLRAAEGRPAGGGTLVSAAVLVLAGVASIAALPDHAERTPGSIWTGPDGSAVASAVQVVLVQPALPGRGRVAPDAIGVVAERLRNLSAVEGEIDLLLWPENVLPVAMPANAHRVAGILASLPRAPSFLLFGAPHLEAGSPHPANAAILTDGQGRALARHEKVKRVPFTEYAPWPLASLWTASLGVRAGVAPRVLDADGVRIGPLVCYELLFAPIARHQVQDGASLLVNLSHDGWFGGLAGARQHASAATLRAIEFRRPLLRVTSDGITLAIDAGGRTRGHLPARQPGALAVRVRPGTATSLYSRTGDAPAWVVCALALAATLRETRSRPARL